MVNFSNVTFGYQKDSPAVRNVSFNIGQGDFTAVVGANGSGKSTLLKLFNGLLKPSSGSVIIKDMDVSSVRTSVLAKHIGFLFQNPDRQICQNTVRDEILFGLRCIYDDEKIINSRCEAMLSEFGFNPDAQPFSLSRGERQRVALASLLAGTPEILILDEPTTGLDYKECMHIMSIVKRLNDNGTTVIMVCHDMELVLDFAKTALVIDKGELLAHSDVKKLFMNSSILNKASLLPPQITGLSFRLGGKYSDIYTVEDMAQRIRTEIKTGRE